MSKSRGGSECDPKTLASSVLITNVHATKDGPPKDTGRRKDSLTPKTTRTVGTPVSRAGSRTSLYGNTDKRQKPKSSTPTTVKTRRESKTKSTEITDYNNLSGTETTVHPKPRTPWDKTNIPQIVCDEFEGPPTLTKSKTTISSSSKKEDTRKDFDLSIGNVSDDNSSSSPDSFDVASLSDDVIDIRHSRQRTSSAKSAKQRQIISSGSQLQHMKTEWNKYGKPQSTRDYFQHDLFGCGDDPGFQRSATPSTISSVAMTSRSMAGSVAAPPKPRVNISALEEVDDDYFDSDEDDKPTKREATVEDIKTIYERACRLVGVVPSKRIERELLGDRVYLDYAGLITAEIKAICIALLNNTTVTRLDLSGNKLCEQAAQYISELVNENVFITNLFCATCQLRSQAVSNIISSVTKSKNMVVLDLSENKIQDEEVELVASLIQKNKTLRELRLRYCDIDEEGGKILAKALADSCLEKLDLSWNQLRQKGGAAFCLALGDNSSIRELDLSWNGLGREGCAALEVSLGKNTTLVQLDLTCNRLCTVCLGHLLKGLESNRVLESLKLTKNLISMEDAKLLASSLLTMDKTSLKVVDISDVTVDNKFVQLQEQLQCKKQISVYFGGFLDRADVKVEQKDRTLASYDPILVLFEYMKQQNLRLIDLFRALDVNHDNAISKEELRNGFLSLNMDLPEGVLCAAFDKLDLNSNHLIDIDELKNAHRRIMRQTAAMMARTHCDDPDEGYGDMLHEFQRLVKAAARTRKTPRHKEEEGDEHGGNETNNKARRPSARSHARQSMSTVTTNLLDARRLSATPRPASPSRPRSPSMTTTGTAAGAGASKKRPVRKMSNSSTSPRASPRSNHSSPSPRGKLGIPTVA